MGDHRAGLDAVLKKKFPVSWLELNNIRPARGIVAVFDIFLVGTLS
jgi:hypothetical protein